MSTNLNISKSAPMCSYAAQYIAPKAGNAASRARKHLRALRNLQIKLAAFDQFFGHVPLLTFSTAFALSAILNCYFGWALYFGILKALSTFAPKDIIVIATSLCFSLGSLFLGNLIARAYNESLFKWRLRRFSQNEDAFIAETQLRAEQKSLRNIAVFSMCIAFAVYFDLGLLREVGNNVQNNSIILNISFIALPFIFFLFEVFTGEFFLLMNCWIGNNITFYWHEYWFEYWKLKCISLDQEVNTFWTEGEKRGEKMPMSADVRVSIWRVHYYPTQGEYNFYNNFKPELPDEMDYPTT